MERFREAFECVFSISSLSLFYPEELALLLCGELGDESTLTPMIPVHVRNYV
jgi:hypothetical protein